MTVENSKEKDNNLDLLVALGEQALDVLHEAGIIDLNLNTDGSISGYRSVIQGVPVNQNVENIRLHIAGGKIRIAGNITESVVDEGKMI